MSTHSCYYDYCYDRTFIDGCELIRSQVAREHDRTANLSTRGVSDRSDCHRLPNGVRTNGAFIEVP